MATTIDGVLVERDMTRADYIKAWRTAHGFGVPDSIVEAKERQKSGYCIHRIYVGGIGPDLMCGKCEVGYDPLDDYRYVRRVKALVKTVRSSDRIGDKTLRHVVAELTSADDERETALNAWNNRKTGENHDRLQVRLRLATATVHGMWAGIQLTTTEAQYLWLVEVTTGLRLKRENAIHTQMLNDVATKAREMGIIEDTIAYTIDRLKSAFRKDRFMRRVNPLAYRWPMNSTRDGLAHIDAVKAWTLGIAREQDQRAWEWVIDTAKQNNYDTRPSELAFMLNSLWVQLRNKKIRPVVDQLYPIEDITQATKAQIITMVTSYFWLEVEIGYHPSVELTY